MLIHNLLNISPDKKFAASFTYLTHLILLFSLTVPALAAAGDLDASFGQNGISVASGLSTSAFGTSIALQPDGKIIVGGIAPSAPYNLRGFALVRYLPDGSVDTSFGNNGYIITPSSVSNSSDAFLKDVAVLPDGKIIAVGWVRVPDTITPFARQSLIVFRYDANGTLDTTFHDNGKYIYAAGGFLSSAESVKVQPDDKFVVAGYTGDAVKGNVPYKSLLFRFAGNTLDPAFHSGQTQVAGNTEGYSVALQADSKIIVGGRTTGDMVYALSLTRYNADGTIDTSFGNNGRIIRPGENLSEAAEVSTQPDGKIVAVASIFPNGNLRDFAVLRFLPDGSPDSSFGTGGKVITAVSNLSDTPSGSALQANGKIVISGFTHNYSVSNSDVFPILIRYNTDGSLDRTFGIGGIVRTPANTTHSDMLIQADGKILTASNPGFRAMRYLANGTRDFDFDGDDKADVSIFRPDAAAEWYWLGSLNGQSSGLQFGGGADKPAPADFDADGKTDVSVFRPADGGWYRLNSSNNTFTAFQFGALDDLPVPGDFDGDGKADICVYRPSAGSWYRINSSNNQFVAAQFGIAEDAPLMGDFDGDGKSDLAVYRPSNGYWYRINSDSDTFSANQFGIAEDKPVAADYDGDGKTDLAVYRPSAGDWYIINSSTSAFAGTHFGNAEDRPSPADFDGDGKSDLAVFRPSGGIWYLLRTSAGFTGIQFGADGDIPTPNAFIR
jgi:uncharacterized delta-60 repeat protein